MMQKMLRMFRYILNNNILEPSKYMKGEFQIQHQKEIVSLKHLACLLGLVFIGSVGITAPLGLCLLSHNSDSTFFDVPSREYKNQLPLKSSAAI